MAHRSLADQSNGYEEVAADFMSIRSNSDTGVAAVRAWASALPPGATILDLGCGHGLPLSKTLIDAGLFVHGVDASPSMVAAFRARFPDLPAECSAIEDSLFFVRNFDAVMAWGLIFLLAQEVQALLINKVACALKPGGRFLFTAPYQACEWMDNLTGRKSVSLGAATYRDILESNGLLLVGETDDEGNNHTYFVCKPDSANPSA